MAYTGTDYFLQVRLANGTSKVRDADIDELMQTKGALLTSNGTSNGLANFTTIMPPGTTNQVLGLDSAGMPTWVSASATAGVNDGSIQVKVGNANAVEFATANQSAASTLTIAAGTTAGYLSIAGQSIQVPGTDILQDLQNSNITSITNLENKLIADDFAKTSDIKDANLDIKFGADPATKLFSANAATAATLTFGEGNNNGAISVNGTDVNVKGLGSAAYEDASAFDAAGAADDALQDAKDYADEKIGDLGHVMSVVGTGASLPVSGENQGDVYIITSGDDAGNEYVWTGSAWELLGQNDIDLSEYTKTEDLGGLALKDSVSVPANTFVTGISATAATYSVIGVGADGASKISGFNPGSAQLEVNDGVLSLAYTAATLTYGNATASTLATIEINNYSATKNNAMSLS